MQLNYSKHLNIRLVYHLSYSSCIKAEWTWQIKYKVYFYKNVHISGGFVVSAQPRSQGLSSYRPLGRPPRSPQGAVRWETLGTRLVSALDSGSSGPGSSPDRVHCAVFLDRTLHSHISSFHPGGQGETTWKWNLEMRITKQSNSKTYRLKLARHLQENPNQTYRGSTLFCKVTLQEKDHVRTTPFVFHLEKIRNNLH